MNNSIPSVKLPYLKQEENGHEPQYFSLRDHYSSRLYIDTRHGYELTDPASSIVIQSSSSGASSPLVIDAVRRVAVKKWNFFYFLDNIVAGRNDTLSFGFRAQSPPQTEVWGPVVLNPGFYTAEDLGQEIADRLAEWLLVPGNWTGGVPLPVVNYTFLDPFSGQQGLLGQILLTITLGSSSTNLSIDPDCNFITGSGPMFILTSYNSYPIPANLPDTPELKISVFSLTPYTYIDVVCNDLTTTAKLKSTNNVSSNYNVIYRINNPQPGYNTYDETQNLFWINQSPIETIYNLRLQFIGPDGRQIPDAITRDFWSVIEFALQ
jgi:hypothetical protein